MNELDLHSVRHKDAKQLIEQYVYENRSNLLIRVIVGNSSRMRMIVIQCVKELGYNTFEDKFTEVTIY